MVAKTSSSPKNIYLTPQWRRIRRRHLRSNPFCRYCEQAGITNDGTRTPLGKKQTNPRKRHLVVDHITPHRGDPKLFTDPANLQTLCPDHHNGDKQFTEKRGFNNRVGDDGWPIDRNHPLNKSTA